MVTNPASNETEKRGKKRLSKGKDRMVFLASAFVLFMSMPPANSSDTFWRIDVSLGDWSIASNWTAGVPTSTSDAIFGIPIDGGALVTTSDAEAQNVFLGVVTTNSNGSVRGNRGTITLARVSGSPPASLTVGGLMAIGRSTGTTVATGTLNLGGINSAVTAGNVEVAAWSGGPFGTVNLSDGFTFLRTNRFTLGNDTGHATLNIQNGAALYCQEATIAGSPFIPGGNSTTGTAAVGGANSLWQIESATPLVVGYVGNGSLTISNGGKVVSQSGTIATVSGSTGVVTVTGNGSQWDDSVGNIFVSGWSGSTVSGGSGSLRVLNGGLVRATMLKVFSTAFVEIDNGSTSVPGLIATGNPPAFTSGGSLGDIAIGNTGSGRMEIRNGGAVRNQRGFIGFNSGSNGAVLVTGGVSGGSYWQNTGSVWVGNGGNGTLEVRDGAGVTSGGNGYVAFSNNTTGYALISGIGSLWSMTSNLYIGGNSGGPGGSGTLQIENSATVNAATTTLYNTGTLVIGADPYLLGPLTIIGGSIQAISNSTFSSDFSLAAGGVHVLTNFSDITFSGVISGSGGLDKSGGFTIGPGTLSLTGNNSYTGGTTISAGRLLANNTSGSATGSGPVTVSTTSGNTVLGGSGTIAGPVTVNSDSILLGGSGVAASGALTLANDLTLNPGAKIQLALGASGAHSTLSRTGGGWNFPTNLAFRLISFGAQPGFYDNIITGLASDPGDVATWTIETPGFIGSFSYDGAGNIDLDLIDSPPPTTCDWGTAAAYPIPILDNGAATVGAIIYSFSGVSNNALTANSYKFDQKSWSAIAPLPEALESPAVVSDGTFVYVMGGNAFGKIRNTLYRYDPASDSYTLLAPSNVATYGSGGAFLNGKLYKVGGLLDLTGVSSNAVEVYDIGSDSWSSAANYPLSVGFVAVFAHDAFVYGAGGLGNSTLFITGKTYRYDPAADSWSDSAIADLPATRFSAAVLLDSVGPVLAGGSVAGSSLSATSASVIRWGPGTNTWSTLPAMLQRRTRSAGAVLNGTLSVIGGRTPDDAFVGSTDHQVQTCPPFSFTVTTVDDHNDGVCNLSDCTLREAITAANTRISADVIAFAPGLSGSIALASVLPDFTTDITIQGPGADLLMVRRDGGPDYRIFKVGTGASVTISGLTIADGRASGSYPANCGGGIYADHGTLNLVNVAFHGNTATLHGGAIFNAQSVVTVSNSTLDQNSAAASGGGIFNLGVGNVATLSLTNCTLDQNVASQYGGAIYNDGTGGGTAILTITNCTLNQNTATLIAGGIYNDALNPGSSGTATLHLGNSILNTGASGENLVNDGATLVSDGHNLSNDSAGGYLTEVGDMPDTDPQLDPAGLANNGGSTRTVALLVTSPAIDGGDEGLAPQNDQRGFARNGISDIGSFEFAGLGPTPTPTPTPTAPPSISISGSVIYCPNPGIPAVQNVTITLTGDSGGSTLTDSSGNYTFSSLASGGTYTVTPSKAALPPATPNIDTVDVIAAQRHFLSLGTPLSGCRLTAADVNADTTINTVDVIAIQRFFLGTTIGIANVGKYQFTPTNRTYPGVGSDQTGQDYDVLIFGDVTSGFVHRPES